MLIVPHDLIPGLFDAEAVNAPLSVILVYRMMAILLGLLTLWVTVRAGESIRSRQQARLKRPDYKPVPLLALLAAVLIVSMLWVVAIIPVLVISWPVLWLLRPLPIGLKEQWFIWRQVLVLVLASFVVIRLFDRMLLCSMYVGRFLLYYASALLPGIYFFVASWVGVYQPGLIILILWPVLPGIIAPFLTGLILGFRLAFSYIYLDVTIETAPPGSHTIIQFGFQGDLKDRVRASLNHSLAYQSHEVLYAISNWIKHVVQLPERERLPVRYQDDCG
jgi:hypothetical protein